jgi:hypothetical protein
MRWAEMVNEWRDRGGQAAPAQEGGEAGAGGVGAGAVAGGEA